MTPRPSEVVGRIERELREMWITDPSAPPKWRACTMNLVVVGPGAELVERYTTIVDEVTRSIPARAIVVALEPEAEGDALEGSATAVCAIEPGRTAAICSERVSLVARGGTCARVPSVVEALCVAELPTTLVWLGRVHLDDPVLLGLAGDAQRIVLDTEYTSLHGLLALARWSSQGPGRPHVADLTWTRLAVWQEMFARFFDPPRLREHASRIQLLRLEQASDPGAPLGPEMALLLGWVGTRLGWRSTRLGGALRLQRADGGNVVLKLGAVPRPHEVAPASLAGVAVEAEHEGIGLRGSIHRELATGLREDTPDADVLAWTLDTEVPSPTEQHVRLRANKGAKLLERTLHRPAADPALVQAALFAEPIIEGGIVCG